MSEAQATPGAGRGAAARVRPARSSGPPARRGWLARLWRGERGAVFAEAVIMLPFFILVWSLIVYVHDAYSHKIATASRTKSCTWLYANSGCRTLPAGCPAARLGNVIEVGSLGGGGAADLAAFASLPIVSGILELILGTDARITGTSTVRKPPLVGSGTLEVRSVHIVMCNEVPKTPGDIARAAFCGLTRLCR